MSHTSGGGSANSTNSTSSLMAVPIVPSADVDADERALRYLLTQSLDNSSSSLRSVQSPSEFPSESCPKLAKMVEIPMPTRAQNNTQTEVELESPSAESKEILRLCLISSFSSNMSQQNASNAVPNAVISLPSPNSLQNVYQMCHNKKEKSERGENKSASEILDGVVCKFHSFSEDFNSNENSKKSLNDRTEKNGKESSSDENVNFEKGIIQLHLKGGGVLLLLPQPLEIGLVISISHFLAKNNPFSEPSKGKIIDSRDETKIDDKRQTIENTKKSKESSNQGGKPPKRKNSRSSTLGKINNKLAELPSPSSFRGRKILSSPSSSTSLSTSPKNGGQSSNGNGATSFMGGLPSLPLLSSSSSLSQYSSSGEANSSTPLKENAIQSEELPVKSLESITNGTFYSKDGEPATIAGDVSISTAAAASITDILDVSTRSTPEKAPSSSSTAAAPVAPISASATSLSAQTKGQITTLEASFISEAPHRIPNNSSDPSSNLSSSIDSKTATDAGPSAKPMLQTMSINSKEGIPVETDLFVGKVMLMVRPPNMKKLEVKSENVGDSSKDNQASDGSRSDANASGGSNEISNGFEQPVIGETSTPQVVSTTSNETEDIYPYERIFSAKKRTVQVQFQGKFKRMPEGILCCGGEITERMKLGLVSKGLCNMLLKMLSKFNSGLHYSFGSESTSDNDDDSEYAHIVFPAWAFFDRIHIAKPGETIPPLGQEFEESPESIRKRRSTDAATSKPNGKSKGNNKASSEGYYGEWNTTDTFSMSFHNMYLDLAAWRLVNLPITKDLDLGIFWGEGMLRLIMYEVIGDAGSKRHLKKDLLYYLGVQIKFCERDDKDIEEGEEDSVSVSDSDRYESDTSPWNKARPEMRRITSYSELNTAQSISSEDDKNESSGSPIWNIHSIDEGDGGENDDSADDLSDSEETMFYDAQSVLSSDHSQLMDWEALQGNNLPDTRSNGDELCPAWIQFWKGKNKSNPNQKYATYFAIRDADGVLKFRQWRQCQTWFSKEDFKNMRMPSIPSRASECEKRRRLLGAMLANMNHDGLSDEVKHALGEEHSDCDEKFLQRSAIRVFSKEQSKFVCFAARARSERHWVEEIVVVTETHVSFHVPGAKYASYRIDTEGIISVSAMDKSSSNNATEYNNNGPNFQGYFFAMIEIIGQNTYLMFSSVDRLNAFVGAVSEVSRREEDSSLTSDGELHMSLDDPAEEFLHKSSLWKCKQRRILNCQTYLFRSFDCREQDKHPCEFMKETLSLALELGENMSQDKILLFLERVSQLKGVNVDPLNEREKLSFFLNLYHVMVLHSYLVLGKPSSSNIVKWGSYYNMVAYQLSDDIFSIAELEHCIIRASMSAPSQSLSKFAIPKSVYKFALTQSDYRINFALNNGSMSNPSSILIYDRSILDEQMDSATQLYVQNSVQLSSTGKKFVISLPRICAWFSSDFGKQPMDIVVTLEKYFRKEDRETYSKHEGNVKIKFQSYSFKCRQITKLQSPAVS